MSLKKEVHQFCQAQLDKQQAKLQERQKQLQQALDQETKSSAGDKHETGRAMVQLELEKLGVQILQTENQQRLLARINPDSAPLSIIALGSLVQTPSAWFYLSIAAGSFEKNGDTFYCISIQSPLGQLLMGQSQGELYSFRGSNTPILKIY